MKPLIQLDDASSTAMALVVRPAAAPPTVGGPSIDLDGAHVRGPGPSASGRDFGDGDDNGFAKDRAAGRRRHDAGEAAMILRLAWGRIHAIYENVQVVRDVPAITEPLKFDGELVARWLLLIGFLVAGVGLERVLPSASKSCRLDSAYPLVNSDADVAMTVKPGMSCSILVKTGTATTNDLEIISAPQHGVVVDRGRTGLVYRAGRGFHGEDFFAFQLHGKLRAHEIVSIVRVAVTVGEGMVLARLR